MDRSAAAFLSLFRTRLFWIIAVFYLIVGGILAGLPLTDYLGLEFSLVVGVFAGLLGGPLAVSVYHRRLAQVSPDERIDAAVEHGAVHFWLEAWLLHTVAIFFSLAGLIVAALITPPCAPLTGVGFFILLPWVSAAYSAAWGLAFAGVLQRPRLAQVLVVVFALLTLALSGLQFVAQPTVWFYNPFFGHFPGPIYDEAAQPTLALLAYRIGNLAAALLIVFLLSAYWGWRLRRTGRQIQPRLMTVTMVVFLLATIIGIDRGRFALGFDMDEAHLLKKLDGYVRTEHFDIHYPRRDDIERQIEMIALDHEFRFSQIEREFGIEYPHRITSFIYANEEMKKKLIGAGGTEYADCAKHYMHLNFERMPIGILHHEMIHVMLSDYGMPLVGFSTKVAVTEGMAVAMGGPIHWDMDLDVWAAGMKAVDRLPRIKKIMGLQFWRESGGRAYTAAGSFIRFLMRQPNGTPRLLAAYATGDLAKQFGRPLSELEDEWRDYLTTVEARLTEQQIERARYRFGFKSIFEMRCPREVGRLLNLADERTRKRYYRQADNLYERAAELDRDNVRIARNRLEPLLRAGRYEQAAQVADLISQAQGTPDNPALDRRGNIVGSQVIAQRAQSILAALAWARGDDETAAAIYRALRDSDLSNPLTREAVCALYAMEHPEFAPAVRSLLTDFRNPRAGEWALAEGLRAHPDDPVLLYLTARVMSGDQAYAPAIATMQRALALGLPHERLTQKAWETLGYAAFMLGDLPLAREGYEQARALLIPHDEQAEVETWLARIEAWPALRAQLSARTPSPAQ
ncbi:MAG TPA: hypothetical protein PKW95_11740 [bacterium]|nr:hypothetical protein [bacterium]